MQVSNPVCYHKAMKTNLEFWLNLQSVICTYRFLSARYAWFLKSQQWWINFWQFVIVWKMSHLFNKLGSGKISLTGDTPHFHLFPFFLVKRCRNPSSILWVILKKKQTSCLRLVSSWEERCEVDVLWQNWELCVTRWSAERWESIKKNPLTSNFLRVQVVVMMASISSSRCWPGSCLVWPTSPPSSPW